MAEQWALLTTVYSGLAADTIKATLELEGIPAMVRGYQVGMFGGGYQGPISEGADILVPESALDRARELVSDDDGSDDDGSDDDGTDDDDIDDEDIDEPG